MKKPSLYQIHYVVNDGYAYHTLMPGGGGAYLISPVLGLGKRPTALQKLEIKDWYVEKIKEADFVIAKK